MVPDAKQNSEAQKSEKHCFSQKLEIAQPILPGGRWTKMWFPILPFKFILMTRPTFSSHWDNKWHVAMFLKLVKVRKLQSLVAAQAFSQSPTELVFISVTITDIPDNVGDLHEARILKSSKVICEQSISILNWFDFTCCFWFLMTSLIDSKLNDIHSCNFKIINFTRSFCFYLITLIPEGLHRWVEIMHLTSSSSFCLVALLRATATFLIFLFSLFVTSLPAITKQMHVEQKRNFTMFIKPI